MQMPPISETRPDHNTGNFVPYSNKYKEDAGDGANGLSSLSEKARTSNYLHMAAHCPLLF